MKFNVISLFILFLYSIPNPADAAGLYEEADRHALQVPDQYSRGLLQLTQYLVHPFEKDEDKIRAIFRWITANVEYDVDALRRREVRNILPQDVFNTKRSVCEGYARLFSYMAQQAGFEAKLIGGYSKGYQNQRQTLFSDDNLHAWNAVRIRGEWRLIDATWGAGYLDEQGRFVKAFNDYYFLTPPEQLVVSHFPQESQWQLLENPLTRDDFENSLYVKPAFFTCRLRAVSHPYSSIETDDSLTIVLETPDNVNLLARLHTGEQELDPRFTFIQRNSTFARIHVTFPDAAVYTLRIYASRGPKTESFPWALDYRIQCRDCEPGQQGFPEQYSDFNDRKMYINFPLDRFQKKGQRVRFSLRLSGMVKAAVIDGNGQFQNLPGINGLFEGDVIVPKGDFFVAVNSGADNAFHYILRYEGL